MADWPEVEEIAQVLNVDNVEAWETTLERVRTSAIRQVKLDVAGSEEAFDEDPGDPDDALAAAALRMAELMSLRPDAAATANQDPTYQRHLKGHRQSFGFA